LGIGTSLKIAILAVPSFYRFIEKRLYSNEKKSHNLLIIYGKTLELCGYSFILLPYMKIFFLLECPCKSQYKSKSLSLVKERIIFLTAKLTG
jgi:Sec-independent protein secretion pathway component TatC